MTPTRESLLTEVREAWKKTPASVKFLFFYGLGVWVVHSLLV